MEAFKKIAELSNRSISETLYWDGREGFILEVYIKAVGQRSTQEKRVVAAKELIQSWAEFKDLPDAMVPSFIDDEAMRQIMGEDNWQPLIP